MRLSIARAHRSGAGHLRPRYRPGPRRGGSHLRVGGWRRMTLLLALVLVVGSVGVLLGSAKPAGADTVFQSGPGVRLGRQLDRQRLRPELGEPVNSLDRRAPTSPTRWAAPSTPGRPLRGRRPERPHQRVRARRHRIGRSSPRVCQPALHRLRQPGEHLRRTADDALHRRVLHPTARAWPTSARSRPSSTATTGSTSSSDECTFYYTSEGPDIYSYNKCTNTQGRTSTRSPSHRRPSPGLSVNAFQLKILAERRRPRGRLRRHPAARLRAAT